MDSLNTVCISGVVERDPRTKFEGDGLQTTTLTLRLEEQGKDGMVFKVYVPVDCYGKVAERAAALSAGDLVGIEGKLKWKSYDHQGQRKGTLCVLARQFAVLVPAAVAME